MSQIDYKCDPELSIFNILLYPPYPVGHHLFGPVLRPRVEGGQESAEIVLLGVVETV